MKPIAVNVWSSQTESLLLIFWPIKCKSYWPVVFYNGISSYQPSTQAFSSRSQHLARNFVTLSNDIRWRRDISHQVESSEGEEKAWVLGWGLIETVELLNKKRQFDINRVARRNFVLVLPNCKRHKMYEAIYEPRLWQVGSVKNSSLERVNNFCDPTNVCDLMGSSFFVRHPSFFSYKWPQYHSK